MNMRTFYRLLDTLEVAGVPITSRTLQAIVKLAKADGDLAWTVAAWIDQAHHQTPTKAE